MKNTYSTPLIRVEELTKVDVLCASDLNGDDSPKVQENYTLFRFILDSFGEIF